MQRHTIIPWQLSPIDERRAPKPTRRRPTWKKCHRGQIINHMYSSGSIKERGLLTPYLKKYPEGDKVVSYQKRGHLEMQTDPSYILLPFLFQKRTHKDRQHFRRRNYQGEQKQSLKRHLSNKKQFILIAHTWIESGYYYYLYYLGIRASFSSFVKCLGRKKNSNSI